MKLHLALAPPHASQAFDLKLFLLLLRSPPGYRDDGRGLGNMPECGLPSASEEGGACCLTSAEADGSPHSGKLRIAGLCSATALPMSHTPLHPLTPRAKQGS